MFNWFKKKSKEREAAKNGQYDFKWFEIGDQNPFNKRILDIRPFTQTIISTTSDPSVVATFNELRSSTGTKYVGQKMPGARTTQTTLSYPHNGAPLNGIVFKSDSMDCKWDIYAYDNCFYFVRSWTGELIYKASIIITADKISITTIEDGGKEEIIDVINNVHFLIVSHATGWAHPHKIPAALINEKEIAHYSFNLFGNRACYACYEDITDTITKKT